MAHFARGVPLVLICWALAGCSGELAFGGGDLKPGVDPTVPTEAVTPAVCGPGSQPETGLQGQVARADRESGRSKEGYWCNLELVGKAAQGEGASWQFAWYEDCGYYGTLYNEARTTQPGTVVIDAADPSKPVVSAVLDTPAMMDPHESLKVNEKRALLAAVELSGGADTGPAGEEFFDIYDVAADCAHPELLASVPFTGTTGHEGEWAPDGMTYYGSGGSEVNAIDVTDPSSPQLVVSLARPSHGLNISDDGNRGYWAAVVPGVDTVTGLTIFDTSQIQSRQPNPAVGFIGSLSWADGAVPQHTIPVTIKGKPYIIFVEEGGRGAARIIDISDEANPVLVSKLKLEVHQVQNSGLDFADSDGHVGFFVYDGHYCAVDRRHEATVVGCGYFESGIRVFDIRDPANPKEIAYYNPPALAGPLLGSSHGGGTADRCTSQVRFIPERGELWTQCQDNEFLVLRFTNGVWPFPESENK